MLTTIALAIVTSFGATEPPAPAGIWTVYTDWKDGWTAPAFDASGWKRGPGAFGEYGTPGLAIGRLWKSPEIWLRRGFKLPEGARGRPVLLIHHDDDAEVYLNGVLAAKTTRYTTSYVKVPISEEARSALVAGENSMAVHCRQVDGGQSIDVGIAFE